MIRLKLAPWFLAFFALPACTSSLEGAVDSAEQVETNVLAESPAVHSMVLMGKDKLYLSHLPRFRSPQDYQMLLEVKLVAPPHGLDATALYLTDSAQSGSPLYSIVSEKMTLSSLLDGTPEHPVVFDAALFRGHSERGAQTIVNHTNVVVVRVIEFRKIDPTALRPPALTYIAFGSEGETFLAHAIAGRPDYDQLLRVQFPSGFLTEDELAAGVELTIPGRPSRQWLKVGETVRAVAPDAALPMPLTVVTEHYLDPIVT